MRVGDRIKEERERIGLNQSVFSDLAGVHRKSQANYENNDRSPDAEYLIKLTSMGIDVLYVLTGMRGENIANGTMELAYLRNCRAFKTDEMKQAGLNLLVNLRAALGIELYPDQPTEKPKNEL